MSIKSSMVVSNMCIIRRENWTCSTGCCWPDYSIISCMVILFINIKRTHLGNGPAPLIKENCLVVATILCIGHWRSELVLSSNISANVKPFMTAIILDRMCFGSNISVLMHLNFGCWCMSCCEPNLPAFHICTFYTHCFKYILILSVQL